MRLDVRAKVRPRATICDIYAEAFDSIIPWARSDQDCRSGLIAGPAGHRVSPVDFPFVRVHRPKKREDAIACINFEGGRRADDEAARGERSWRECSRTEAGRMESSCPGDRKAPFRAGPAALSHIGCHVECFSPRSRKGAAQGVRQRRYLVPRDASPIAIGTAALDGVRPGKGGLRETPGERNDLSNNRRGNQGTGAGIQGPSQVHGGQLIKAIRTLNMQCACYQTAGLTDAAGKLYGGCPRDRGDEAEIPITCNVQAHVVGWRSENSFSCYSPAPTEKNESRKEP